MLSSEDLIRDIERKGSFLRLIELCVVIAILIFNIFLLAEIHITQDQAHAQTLNNQKQQLALLHQAQVDSEADHQETIRFLRCTLELNQPRTFAGIDACIASSSLPDSAQIPPITTPSGAGTSTNPKVPTATSQPAPIETTAPTPTPSPTPVFFPTPTPQPPTITKTLQNLANDILNAL